MPGENPTNEVPVDLDTERGRDDQRDARTAESGIAALEFDDCLNELCAGSLGTGLAAPLRGEQLAVLTSDEILMKPQQRRGLNGDRDPDDAGGSHKECKEPENKSLRG
jgi:hypothetical protein